MRTYNYPDPGLKVGVSQSQLDFLVAVYVGAFTRAPEYEGLKYWGGYLARELAQKNESDAFIALSKQMYSDGKGNGEGGTQLNDKAYVDFAYKNILGRTGDTGGVDYWNNQLSSGSIDRGSFVSKFVSDALGNPGDGEFLEARISVAKFAAQEKVSGPGSVGINLGSVIADVYDVSSALAAIEKINQRYGAPDPVTPEPPVSNPGGGNIMHFAGDFSKPETWDMNFNGYLNFEITEFDVANDKLYFGSILKNFEYTGEPRTYSNLSEYFTKVAGQAAFVRETSELLVDLNGDGRYVQGQDMLIKLPNVFQLEDSNFTI